MEVANVNNTDLFHLRAVVDGVDLDTGCTQLYYIIEVIFVDLTIGNV